jgi:tetratricopeptide (TPR) repeat protein
MNARTKEKPNTPLHGWLSALALGALGFALYLPILPGSFLMDDERLVKLDNPILSGKLGPLSVWFQADFPLSNFVFWLQWLAWGHNPAGYHAVNILLHGASAVLLWRILVRLKIPGGWLAAALFAAHPVCVASVGRIAELKNTLSLVFFLLSAWAYLGYETSISDTGFHDPTKPVSRQRRAWIWYTVSLMGFVLAFLSKSTVLVLPVMLLACAAWQRGRVRRQDVLHTSPHFVLALGYGLMAMWFQKYQALAGAGEALQPHAFAERLISASKAFWFYLGKSLLPLNLNLVYPRWQVNAVAPSAYIPLLLIAGMAGLCWAFRRTWGRHALFALVCFGAALFPALGFFDAQFLTKWQVSDHLQYLALIAPIALVGATVASLPRAHLQSTVSLVLLLGLSALTLQRAKVFATEETLLRDTLAKNPAAWAAHNDLGCISAQKQDYYAASHHFAAALDANPSYPDAHLNLGQTLAIQGKSQEAEGHFLAVLEIQPYNAMAHRQLAGALAAQRRRREAIPHFQRALSLHPDTQTRLDFAALLYETGDPRRAARELRRVVSLNPESSIALNNLAWLLATCSDESLRDGKKAVSCAERACHLTGFKDAMTVGTLAAAYAEAGRFPQAVATAEIAGRLAAAAGDTRIAAVNEQFLSLYRSGKSWHEPDTKGKEM